MVLKDSGAFLFSSFSFWLPEYICSTWGISILGHLKNAIPLPRGPSSQQSNGIENLGSWHCAQWSSPFNFGHPHNHSPENSMCLITSLKMLRIMTPTFQAHLKTSFFVIAYCQKRKYSPSDFCILMLALLFQVTKITLVNASLFPFTYSDLNSYLSLPHHFVWLLPFSFISTVVLISSSIFCVQGTLPLADTSLKLQCQQAFGDRVLLPQREKAIVTLKSMGIPMLPLLNSSVNK